MISVINISLSVIGVFAVFFVISGHTKEEHFTLMPNEFKKKTLFDEMNEVKIIEKEKKNQSCRPIYNCRRVGYFCSKVN